MSINAAGIIFANRNEHWLPELTQRRVLSSVPFGGRYRMIDFALSSMVNSGISRVGLVTDANYQSLLDHIGSGKDWDLAHRSGGLHLLPPFSTADAYTGGKNIHRSRLRALADNIMFVRRCTEDYIVITDGSIICNIDFNDIIRKHIENHADITLVTRKIEDPSKADGLSDLMVITRNSEGRIVDMANYSNQQEAIEISTRIMVFGKQTLLSLLAKANAYGMVSMQRDLLRPELKSLRIFGICYDGLLAVCSSLQEYFHYSMELLKPEVRAELNKPGRPILTKVRNSAPVIYKEGSRVTNSLLADGCVIEGTVENCILFRGVRVGKGAVVRNSILLQDTYVASGVDLNCVVTDKDVVIRDDKHLSGDVSLPFYISKGQII